MSRLYVRSISWRALNSLEIIGAKLIPILKGNRSWYSHATMRETYNVSARGTMVPGIVSRTFDAVEGRVGLARSSASGGRLFESVVGSTSHLGISQPLTEFARPSDSGFINGHALCRLAKLIHSFLDLPMQNRTDDRP